MCARIRAAGRYSKQEKKKRIEVFGKPDRLKSVFVALEYCDMLFVHHICWSRKRRWMQLVILYVKWNRYGWVQCAVCVQCIQHTQLELVPSSFVLIAKFKMIEPNDGLLSENEKTAMTMMLKRKKTKKIGPTDKYRRVEPCWWIENEASGYGRS